MQSITARVAIARRLAAGAAICLMLGGCAATSSHSERGFNGPGRLSATETSRGAPDVGYRAFGQVSDSIGPADFQSVRAALMAEYESWKGTPYRFGGESSAGIDCSALVQRIFRDSLDFDLPRSTRGQALIGQRVDKAALKTGDLVFFKPEQSGRHVGIYLDDGRFLHASSSKGVRISRLDNPYWQRYYWQSRRALDNAILAMRSS